MRAAYCVGCGEEFTKMHHMINHRRTFRCGGRFLPPEQRAQINASKMERQFTTEDIREREKVAQRQDARVNKAMSLTRRLRAQRELARRTLLARRNQRKAICK